MATSAKFKTRARLMEQLGEQLIKNENVAILELIKNAYDANATKVTVGLFELDNPKRGHISIVDNGEGMDLDTVLNVWLEIGTDNKKKKIEEAKKTGLASGRLPLGEKGIGRFGAHKLGNIIEMVTRRDTSKEVVVSIDWRVFRDYDYLDEVPIEVVERDPELFTGSETGTCIHISDLKRAWDRRHFRNLYRSINALSSPFEAINSFHVVVETNLLDWIDGLTGFSDIKDNAVYKVEAILSGCYVEDFRYEFSPKTPNGSIEGRIVHKEKIEMVDSQKKGEKTAFEKIDLNENSIGDVRFSLLIFDLDSKYLALDSIDKKSLTEYLKNNGGIALYRDNVRLYEYGDRENDWLELESRRINNPSKTISSRICVGAVYLNRWESEGLVEKASREGLVDNDSLETLKKAIWFLLENLILPERNSDKELLRAYSGGKKAKQPVKDEIKKLTKIIETSDMAEKTRKEIVKTLNQIDSEYEYITTVYLRSASTGLSIGTVIHEIEKMISELMRAVKEEGATEHIAFLVSRLSRSTESYSALLRDTKKKKVKAKRLVEEAEACVEYRLKAHGIMLSSVIENDCKTYGGNIILSTLINLIDNSIYWIDYSRTENKRICMFVDSINDKYVRISIIDSGAGFSIDPERATLPFVSAKKGGMGLGLNLAKQVVEDCSGFLSFPDIGEFDLPNDIKWGAAVSICLPIFEG